MIIITKPQEGLKLNHKQGLQTKTYIYIYNFDRNIFLRSATMQCSDPLMASDQDIKSLNDTLHGHDFAFQSLVGFEHDIFKHTCIYVCPCHITCPYIICIYIYIIYLHIIDKAVFPLVVATVPPFPNKLCFIGSSVVVTNPFVSVWASITTTIGKKRNISKIAIIAFIKKHHNHHLAL